jgi:hypothetical protein
MSLCMCKTWTYINWRIVLKLISNKSFGGAWVDVALDRSKSRDLVNAVINSPVTYIAGIF